MTLATLPELAGRTISPHMVGSHTDLIPTLIELAAPAGFSYHAWGHDLLGPEHPWSIGTQAVVTPARWRDISVGNAADMGPISDVDFTAYQHLAQSYAGLAWWRLVHGPILPTPQSTH